MQSRFKLSHLSLAIVAASLSPCTLFAAEVVDAEVDALSAAAEPTDAITLKDAVVTAKQELKQAPGVSIITAEDIKKRPPANDLSDVIRREPGVNLTGNSTSGSRATIARSTCAAWARKTL